MRTLNFIIPIAYAIGLTIGMFIYAITAKLLFLLGVLESTSITLGGWIALVLVIASAYLFVRSYVDLQLKLSKKVKVGHILLAIGNIAALFTTLGPLLFAYIKGNPDYGLYTAFAIPVFLANFILWPTGWKYAQSSN